MVWVRMPWRMPNWKMRVKALSAGWPDHQSLQDAERGIGLHDPHQAQHRRRPTSGCRHRARSYGRSCRRPRSANSRRLPALKPVFAGGGGSAGSRRGDGGASRPAKCMLLGRGDLGLAAVAQQMEGEAIGPGRGLQALDHGGRVARRPGPTSSWRTARQTATRSVIGRLSRRAPKGGIGVARRDRRPVAG